MEFGLSAPIKRLSKTTRYYSGVTLLHANSKNLLALSFQGVNSLPGAPYIDVGIGFQAVLQESFFVIPFSVEARYHFPQILFNDVALNFRWDYGPDILSFNDSKNYSNARIEVATEMIDTISFVVGYREVNTNYKNKEMVFDRGVYAGAKFAF